MLSNATHDRDVGVEMTQMVNEVRSPSFPKTAAQQGIWLQEKLHPRTAFCNVGAYVEIDGLDLRKFEQALRHVVADTAPTRSRCRQCACSTATARRGSAR